ncbi:hypothetical protein JTE90_004351 [Oedothorax gibbosus]|uniref:Uncharacterized protein n=1 Tax=Oedothorax gibbosus TaxID=931172 RepID=A0AAV6VJV8_9ARAC|nr:hypothetical protein JTE90_004351 [Oedothorax gibbosus]
MKPKQKITKPTPSMKSSVMLRLLKWIQRKCVANGCVTYNEVKEFVETNEKYDYKVQGIMEVLLKNGHLEKFGWKYIVPTPSRSKILKHVHQAAATNQGKQKTTQANKDIPASTIFSEDVEIASSEDIE